MRRNLLMVALPLLLVACRGEKVPRDYQNSPPAMTHPVTSQSQTPTAHGMPGPSPQPSSGVEAQNYQPVNPTGGPAAKVDNHGPFTNTAPPGEPNAGPPPQNTAHATETAPVAVTGTHLARKP